MQNSFIQNIQKWDKRTLTVLALSLLTTLLFALGCLVSYQKLRNERQDQDRAEAQRMLLAFEAHSTRLFDYADGQLRAIRSYLNEHGNHDQWVSFVREIKAPHAQIFTGVVHVVDRDGWIVYQSETPQDQLKALGKMSDLDHYQYFVKHPGDSLFVGGTRLGRVTGKLQYRLARPLLKNGVFDGLVVLTLLPEHITDFFLRTRLGPRSVVTMMTQEQKLIARQPSASPEMYGRVISNLTKTYGIGTTAPGEGGSVLGIVSSFDQMQRDAFYKNLADYPVTLVVSIAKQDLDDTLAGVRRNLGLLAAAFTLFSMLVCALVLRMLSQHRRLVTSETASRQAFSELRRLSDHQQNIKEGERKRIAQDIHDDLGQNLLALKMDVATLHARTADAHPKLNQRVSLVLNNINATIKSLKSIMNDLRPATLNLGLHPALEWQLKQFERVSGITCKLVANEETELGLDEERISAVFRIFQESLANVARHANATEVEIILCKNERGFSMKIKDNGKGLLPGDRRKANSFGLIGIQERVEALGGELTITSSRDDGTALSIFIAMEESSKKGPDLHSTTFSTRINCD